MSFILDALKKSEAERQRQTGPTLLELRVTHPRRRYPIWVIVIGSLLAVNAIVLLFVALHRPSTPGGSAGTAASASASPLSASPPTTGAASVVAAPPAAASGATSAAFSPASAASAKPAAAVPPLAATADDAASAATATTSHNPADDEPAVSAQGPLASGQVRPPLTAGSYANLPSAATLGDSVPTLQLNMLVSSKDTADRYALINMHRVHEGDVLPEGARVLAITPDGVAMEYHGQDFLLPRAATAGQ